ncbi:MAG: glutamate--cysteine ligase [Legionella sp.]|nr:MAG: glutamate--cysteine ligase [Legionella sp.]
MSNFPLFSVMGIEIEYMLVDEDSLDVQAKSDVLLHELAQKPVNEVVLQDIALSNELVLHVLEFKNHVPQTPETDIAAHFQQAIDSVQSLLAKHHLKLLPSGAHPWMNPEHETQRWPHGDSAIYKQYDSIFNCQGHGWSNLQSMHLNLPYSNEEEFAQLHAVTRLILPLIPALAASSPILDGKPTGVLDSRLQFYEQNQKLIPEISGDIIPESMNSETEYQHHILEPMYAAIRPHDPEGLLQYPWLNSRGCIPKFDLQAIEIRIIDSQECVNADIAIAKALFAILKHWQQQANYQQIQPCSTGALKQIFDQTIRQGMNTRVDNREVLSQWQLPQGVRSVREIWSMLIEKISSQLQHKEQRALEIILSEGNLSERLLKAIGSNCNRQRLQAIYSQLAHSLLTNQQFVP